MTPDDPPEAEPNAARDPEALDRLVGVRTARGVKSAPSFSEQLSHHPVLEREGFLVESNEKKDGLFRHTLKIESRGHFVNALPFAILIQNQHR